MLVEFLCSFGYWLIEVFPKHTLQVLRNNLMLNTKSRSEHLCFNNSMKEKMVVPD